MFWWPSSLVYFIPPAFLLLVAVYVLARHEPQRPPASTTSMLGMPIVWGCVASLIGHMPALAWVSFGPMALLIFILAMVLMAIASTLPMGVVSLAASRLGDAALFRMMWAMALAAGVSMIVGYIISEALFAHGMLRDNGTDLLSLAALCSVCGASIGAISAAPTAHRARPFMGPPRGICPDCGYDARDLERCPECGAKLPES